MSTTFCTDEDVYLRAPLAGDALARVNTLRAARSVTATTVDAYRVEARRQVLLALSARGVAESEIAVQSALLDPEAHLAAALLFEAASVRTDAVQGMVDVFSSQATLHRARYAESIAAAQPLGEGLLPRGRVFAWGRA